MISTAALALAYTAGLVATINPCGFAMLPVYLGFFMGSDDDAEVDRATALARALKVGLAVSTGFIVVFGAAGLLLNIGLQAAVFRTVLPWMAITIGVGVTVLGVAMLRGYSLNVRLPGVRGAKKERTFRSMFAFGTTYAIASLSCTLPVFLSLVTANFAQQSVVGGTLTFVVYGLGMATVLMYLSVTMALGRDSIIKRMRNSARYLNTVSAVILIGAGLFIVWYWGTILTQGAVVAGQSGLVRWVDETSAFFTNLVGNNRRLVAAAGVGTIGATVLYIIGKNALSRDPGPSADDRGDRVSQSG